MIQDIFDSGKGIFDLAPLLYGKTEDERHMLAQVLERIGHVVIDSVVKLRHGQRPTGKSRQLELLSEELYLRLAFSIGEMKARALTAKLNSGYKRVQQQRTLDESQSTHHHLTTLESAAGYFLTASDQLRKAMRG
jgi:hypothetical protein